MRTAMIIGAIFVAIGIIGFVIGGVPVKQNETQAQIGNLKIEAETQKTYAIPPWAAGGAIALGLVIIGIGATRRNA